MISATIEKALLVLRQQHEHLFYLDIPFGSRVFNVVFRPLSFKEANGIDSVGEALSQQVLSEWIVELCTMYLGVGEERLHPENLDETPAGLAERISKAHEAQTLNYLAASGLKVALILNFKNSKLEYKRLVK